MSRAAADDSRRPGSRRSFSARARRAAFLHAHGHSRKETAKIVGVRPETISVWKRHPQWRFEVDRWRALAEEPLDKTQLRLQLEAAEATIEALAHLRRIMDSATKRVRTPTGIKEEPDWARQLKACRLVLTTAFAAIPEFRAGASQAPPDRRTLRIVP
jgi:transposase